MWAEPELADLSFTGFLLIRGADGLTAIPDVCGLLCTALL